MSEALKSLEVAEALLKHMAQTGWELDSKKDCCNKVFRDTAGFFSADARRALAALSTVRAELEKAT